jgi:DNA topoisomerase VI subunit B
LKAIDKFSKSLKTTNVGRRTNRKLSKKRNRKKQMKKKQLFEKFSNGISEKIEKNPKRSDFIKTTIGRFVKKYPLFLYQEFVPKHFRSS